MPQYIPVAQELIKKGFIITFVSHGVNLGTIKGAKTDFIPKGMKEVDFYNRLKPDWLIIGNSFQEIARLNENIKTALVSHGIGPKACYYTVSDTPTDVRFVEGPYRTERLRQMYPNQTFIDTGYAKLDPAINGELSGSAPSDYGLDNNKKTLLYAPTFYPSSIERFSRSFPDDFGQYNIILKPHYFSLSIEKYKKQKALLEHWATFDNVYLAQVEESNILPFMAVSDVLISDASSTLFEFAALDKPVVWCDFLKLRWAYRGILKFRFKKRMDQDLYKYADIAAHAQSYAQLRNIVDEQIERPNQYAVQRAKYTLSLAGKVDGKASERIVNYMLQNSDI
ncbi:MAG: CDP-glycerol glycerophosphotransferase family protein [Bermanella sp.]